MRKLNLKLRAELLMAMEDYRPKRLKHRDTGVDISARERASKNKILLRVITQPQSKSGWVSTAAASAMISTVEDNGYDQGVLIAERFTDGAKRKLREEGIRLLSKQITPDYKPTKLILIAEHLVDNLCKANCGKPPRKELDCKGYRSGHYSCEVRRLSDNADFHLKRGWMSLLKNDVLELLALSDSERSLKA